MSEDKSQRAQRLAQALRANLGRRKQQARQRPSTERHDTGEPDKTDRDAPGTERPPGKA